MTLYCPEGHPLPPEYVLSKTWRHTFSPVLESALRKFQRGVARKGRNEIHLRHDLTGDLKLTTDELNNFTKLRFHALVAKVRINGHHKQGYWLLTRRGSRSLKRQESIPRWVKTRDNHVIDHSQERIWIGDQSGLPPIDLSFEIADGDVFVPPDQQRKLFELRPAFNR